MLVQWEPAQLVPLLYQTGYLTLAPSRELAPPNREIAAYLSHVLLDPWLDPGEMTRATWFQAQMLDALQHLDIPGMVAHFNALLHLLPHQRFQGSGSRAYNLVLDLVVLLAHGHIGYLIPDRNPSHDMEMSGLQGDLDTALGWDDISLVLEFKTGFQASAHSGQTQIREHAYLRALPRKSRLYLGLSLYLTERQIAAWECRGYSDLGDPGPTPGTPGPLARTQGGCVPAVGCGSEGMTGKNRYGLGASFPILQLQLKQCRVGCAGYEKIGKDFPASRTDAELQRSHGATYSIDKYIEPIIVAL